MLWQLLSSDWVYSIGSVVEMQFPTLAVCEFLGGLPIFRTPVPYHLQVPSMSPSKLPTSPPTNVPSTQPSVLPTKVSRHCIAECPVMGKCFVIIIHVTEVIELGQYMICNFSLVHLWLYVKFLLAYPLPLLWPTICRCLQRPHHFVLPHHRQMHPQPHRAWFLQWLVIVIRQSITYAWVYGMGSVY